MTEAVATRLKADPSKMQYIDVRKLTPWDRNPRVITAERFQALKRSLATEPDHFRARPAICMPDSRVVGGNMRVLASLELVNEEGELHDLFIKAFPAGKVPAYVVELTESQAIEWAFRDNQPYGEYDDDGRNELLRELELMGGDLDLTGFDNDDLASFFEAMDDDAPPPVGEDDDRGQDLALSDVSLGNPKHAVSDGEVWSLDHHLLVCSSVYEGWPTWAPLLTEGKLFVPYPTPTVPLTERAQVLPLVLVQPDPWMAGHLVDKYAAVKGEDSVARVNGLARDE